MVFFDACNSPFGKIRIGYEDGAVVSVCRCDEDFLHIPSPISELACKQLEEYFSCQRKTFDFPIRARGTAFQQAVWQALREIPYGEVRSYGQIAAKIGKPGAARAVGMACNRNPLWIVIPCHRVVGSNRKLTGYAGGLDMKQALLKLEQYR